MKLCFDSIEELKTFYSQLKGTRGKGKGDDGDDTPAGTQAPPPLQPPQGPPGNFAPAQFTPPANPFPAQAAIDPAIGALVQRIVTKIDGAIAGGQPADAVLNWFRGQCGAEAAAATMDQIKSVFLHKLPMPGLENIAKLMNA